MDRLKLPKGTVLQGKINDLVNYLANGWRRRDITVWQDATKSYPNVGDRIILIDTEGDRYYSEFTKPEESGHVCLGKPKNLEKWYRKHYPASEVKQEEIYLEYTGHDVEFLILTSKQWYDRKANTKRKRQAN